MANKENPASAKSAATPNSIAAASPNTRGAASPLKSLQHGAASRILDKMEHDLLSEGGTPLVKSPESDRQKGATPANPAMSTRYHKKYLRYHKKYLAP